ncbi:MAG: radical SAM protein [Elusimicrobiota bacterium]
MKQIAGFNKYLYLCKAFFNWKIRELPWEFILFMIKQMRHEKITLDDKRIFINTTYTPFPSPAFDTAIKTFVSLSKGKAIPFSVFISLTNRCPLDCWHCSKVSGESHEISFETLSGLIKQLQLLGVCCIGFTGGEPALRADLEKLIAEVDNRSYTLLFTSGYLINQERARELKKSGLTAIVVSLDSHLPEEHNRLRKSEKAFADAVAAITGSLTAGIYTATSLVISREMLYSDKIDDYIRFVSQLGVQEIRILDPKPCGKLMNTTGEMFDENDAAKLREVQHQVNQNNKLAKIMALSQINSLGNYGCNAGRTHLYINAHGEVCPCDFVPLSFGNILTEDFQTIYLRMNQFFPRPAYGCIISKIHQQINQSAKGQLPIKDLPTIENLLGQVGPRPVPKLFEKLGG